VLAVLPDTSMREVFLRLLYESHVAAEHETQVAELLERRESSLQDMQVLPTIAHTLLEYT